MWFLIAQQYARYIPLFGTIFAFFGTIFLMKAVAPKLPHDQGRAFAVEGSLSKGKVRGVGLVFVLVYALTVLLFDELSAEKMVYLFVIVATMFTGFFDDASEKPWNEYVKGALDLILALIVAVTYLYRHGSYFRVLPGVIDDAIHIPVWLAAILIVALVWTSINVTNCTDGVDGLSATLTIITLGSFLIGSELQGYPYNTPFTAYFLVVLSAYLWYNANPSTMLMGDAGSRAMGMMIAIIALLSEYPLMFIPYALVMILDGGLGLLKVALLRFLKIRILTNTRCPLHDQARKVNGWSNTQVVFRFALIQFAICVFFLWLY